MNLIWRLRNKFKLVRMVYLDLVYFAGVKNLSTQFRNDMLAAYRRGQAEKRMATSVFDQWFKDNYL